MMAGLDWWDREFKIFNGWQPVGSRTVTVTVTRRTDRRTAGIPWHGRIDSEPLRLQLPLNGLASHGGPGRAALAALRPAS